MDTYEEAGAKHWHGLTPHTSTIEDYQLLQTAREEYILRRIRNEMIAAAIPVEFSKGEAGRGQHEVNVTYDEALETADRHLVFKNGIKEIAAQEGRAATFMAKWTMEDVGSSCHVHTSLWDRESGDALMADESHPSGLSTLARRFLAGQLYAARAAGLAGRADGQLLPALHAGQLGPHRGGVGRGQPHLRLPGGRATGRGAGWSRRVPGADVNPYLVLAAQSAAGLYGIDHELELGEPFPRNAYEATDVTRIPSTLIESIEELRGSRRGPRGLRARRAPPPAQHGGAGVGGLQPPRHRLGAGPQLRAHLSAGRAVPAPMAPVRSPDHVALATVLGRVAALPGSAGLGRPVAPALGGRRATNARSCSTARCGSGSSSPRRCASVGCWPGPPRPRLRGRPGAPGGPVRGRGL